MDPGLCRGIGSRRGSVNSLTALDWVWCFQSLRWLRHPQQIAPWNCEPNQPSLLHVASARRSLHSNGNKTIIQQRHRHFFSYTFHRFRSRHAWILILKQTPYCIHKREKKAVTLPSFNWNHKCRMDGPDSSLRLQYRNPHFKDRLLERAEGTWSQVSGRFS